MTLRASFLLFLLLSIVGREDSLLVTKARSKVALSRWRMCERKSVDMPTDTGGGTINRKKVSSPRTALEVERAATLKEDGAKSIKRFMEDNVSPEIVAILAIYFVQGALGISKLAVTFFLKDQLHLSPSEAAALTGLTTLPWIIKPLYGFMSDGFPIFGYKRRSYLILAGLL